MKFELKDYLSDFFIETGTFHGAGVRAALSAGFKKVISIEVYEPLMAENANRFKTEIAEGKVDLVYGDSDDVLEDILDTIDGSITFWLDAHKQTMNGAGEGKETCPVVSELEHILNKRADNRNDIILIDDMRLIEDPNVGWAVNLGEMYRLLWLVNPDFTIERIEGFIAHDVLACSPKR